MSDSSEDEDMSRFKDAVDNSFMKNINSIGNLPQQETPKPKSERYLEESSHYNDVKVPDEKQRQIAAKVSAIIEKKIKFVDIKHDENIQNSDCAEIEGGVRLFSDSTDFLSCEEQKDTYTEGHNLKSKKLKIKKRKIDEEEEEINEDDKIKAATLSGEYVMSKEEIKSWKSRRKEKLFKYKKQNKNSKVLTAVE
ncbi:hypothetical protein JYU34_012251 [Plutella xylostella]|uniref:Protein CUSTOS n=1 Tax=Plutella xylostella TaxID=51655 RepID=A0ABQ7QFY4_PLUXY|nr:hypothetical protein JYU34_012251 [Plutella xylostella]